MKRFFSVIIFFGWVFCSFAQEPKLVFIDKRITKSEDVKAGEIVKKNIRIKNTGDADLLITNYKGSCNCTKVELPKVIKPGKEGKINIEIDTTGKQGMNTITILIETNTTQKDYIVRIDMNIVSEKIPSNRIKKSDK